MTEKQVREEGFSFGCYSTKGYTGHHDYKGMAAGSSGWPAIQEVERSHFMHTLEAGNRKWCLSLKLQLPVSVMCFY